MASGRRAMRGLGLKATWQLTGYLGSLAFKIQVLSIISLPGRERLFQVTGERGHLLARPSDDLLPTSIAASSLLLHNGPRHA